MSDFDFTSEYSTTVNSKRGVLVATKRGDYVEVRGERGRTIGTGGINGLKIDWNDKTEMTNKEKEDVKEWLLG